jgi:hypothetical protein
MLPFGRAEVGAVLVTLQRLRSPESSPPLSVSKSHAAGPFLRCCPRSTPVGGSAPGLYAQHERIRAWMQTGMLNLITD